MSVLPAASPTDTPALRKMHVVSLGCPKNRVDTELMVGQMHAAGFSLTTDASEADVLMVNTCAFIEESKTESIDAILELADVKAARPGTKLVVAGCLAQRHAAELAEEMPEVDAFIGTGEYDKLAERLGLQADGGWRDGGVLYGHKKGRPEYIADHLEPRWIAPDSWTAYLKIAEGCDQACSFCIIPKLRGKQRSRSVEDCVAEAQQLVAQGVLEINLVAQDLTHYGIDIGEPEALARLIRALGKVEGLRWVRLMYAYPHNVSDELIAAIAETENCCKYVDMPLQHAADNVLKAMKRLTTRAEIEALLDKMRARIPGLTLRTTLLVGHPGETDADFAELLDFVKTQRFTRVGCFAYSKEDGTLSGRLGNQIPTAVKKARQHQVMKLQEKISSQIMQSYVGQVVDVLVEGLSQETDLLLQGRMQGQAPEIDGLVYINDAPDDIGRGQMRRVEITQAGEHDLVGHVVNS
jgi:ribosomal protein S12 methylthiotransferase